MPPLGDRSLVSPAGGDALPWDQLKGMQGEAHRGGGAGRTAHHDHRRRQVQALLWRADRPDHAAGGGWL